RRSLRAARQARCRRPHPRLGGRAAEPARIELMRALKRTLLTVGLITAAMAYAFRIDAAGTPQFWAALAVPYLLLAALAVRKLWDEGALLDVLQPRWGDFSLGFLTAAILLLAS